MQEKNPKTKTEEYTLILVPHSGKSVCRIHIPAKLIKYIVTALCVMVVFVIGMFIDYRHTANVAQSERAELQYLRQINGTQVQQLEEIAQKTVSIESDLNRLDQLDAEVRRMINSEDSANTASRAGSSRRIIHNGQGGPHEIQVADLSQELERLQQELQQKEESLKNLRDSLIDRQEKMNSTPSIWPASGEVTSRYGWRSSPFGGGGDWHPGIDIANDYGVPICATANGIVVYAGWYSGYGKLVQIDHGNGIVTFYGHNNNILVHEGQHVNKGEVISQMGSTGYSTGPHVHYEIRVNGSTVNPANFL